MSNGTQTGAWAPSRANQIPFERASAAMSLTGKSWPVVQVTWLRMMSRVRPVISLAIRSTFPAPLRISGSKRRMTIPSRSRRLRSPVLTATCSWVEVMTSSPALSASPLMIIFTPSVAQLMRARSSLRQVLPRRAASLSLTAFQRFSSCPALGARSSSRVNSARLWRTGRGQDPRPPKFRNVHSGSRTNWSRMSFQKASSSPAAPAFDKPRSAAEAECAVTGSPRPARAAADRSRNSLRFMGPPFVRTIGRREGPLYPVGSPSSIRVGASPVGRDSATRRPSRAERIMI